jgi:hypothetical protein
MSPRWRLVLASAAFLAWIGYLGYAAFSRSRAPVVSHIQSAAAEAAVVAELTELPDGPTPKVPSPKATVAEKLWGDAPDGTIEVVNFATVKGFAGPGKYLLYLARAHDGWAVVPAQRSPGDAVDPGAALIYAWGEDVRKQAERLKPKP